MPRVRMTSSWPSDRTAIAAVAAMTLPRLRVVRKNGERSAIAAIEVEEDRATVRCGGAASRSRGTRSDPGRARLGAACRGRVRRESAGDAVAPAVSRSDCSNSSLSVVID